MESIKAFFAKDAVKIICGGLYVVLNGLLVTVLPEGALKNTLIGIWNGLVTPAAIYLGITSGGTSGLRNDTSRTVTQQLKIEGVVK